MRTLLTVIALVIFSTFTPGCKKDACKGVVCQNGGSCNDGHCSCPSWYEGNFCETEMREKFVGSFRGTSTVDGSSSNVETTLSKHPDNPQKILWDNTQFMLLSGSSTIDIPLQNVYGDGVTFSIEGSGSISGNQLILNYTASYLGVSIPCSFIGSK